MATGIAMQGISAAIVINAIEKIDQMIADADATLEGHIEPAITKAISEIPDTPESTKANYATSAAAASAALGGVVADGGGPGVARLPALLDGTVSSFFTGYLSTMDSLFPGLSAAGADADAFVERALTGLIGISYSEAVDRAAGETVFTYARAQAFVQERAAYDAAAAAGHRFAPGATMDAVARIHAETLRGAAEAIAAAHKERLAQERSDKMRMVRAEIGTRMDRVKKVQQQTAEAFKLKLRARGMWVDDQNAVIDAHNNKYLLNAQLQARIGALMQEAAAKLHSSNVQAREAGDRAVEIGKLKMANGQEIVDLLGGMVGTLLNQVRGSGSYSGDEQDVTDWDSVLA